MVLAGLSVPLLVTDFVVLLVALASSSPSDTHDPGVVDKSSG